MTPRRRHRLFRDHAPPLVAFVVVMVMSVVLLAYMVRSDAAPGWMTDGWRAAQRVVGATAVERSTPAADADPPRPATVVADRPAPHRPGVVHPPRSPHPAPTTQEHPVRPAHPVHPVHPAHGRTR
ncbi:hypothetical protein [Nocardioides sp.]|uniref:hypothetical protein n=1 Tax=Nocardioides sp. TaxID=35761 RepID=UPI003785164D